jgi:calcineurin-like phosphoesterase family protein
MKTIWFTSDTHFSHNNIIRYCNRPFSNVEEMDEVLINNWNNKVKQNDDVYHLGDIIFSRDKNKTYDFLKN